MSNKNDKSTRIHCKNDTIYATYCGLCVFSSSSGGIFGEHITCLPYGHNVLVLEDNNGSTNIHIVRALNLYSAPNTLYRRLHPNDRDHIYTECKLLRNDFKTLIDMLGFKISEPLNYSNDREFIRKRCKELDISLSHIENTWIDGYTPSLKDYKLEGVIYLAV